MLNVLARLEKEASIVKQGPKGASSRKIVSSYQQILANAWKNGDVYNPLLSEADIPGGWPLSGKLMWDILALSLTIQVSLSPFCRCFCQSFGFLCNLS